MINSIRNQIESLLNLKIKSLKPANGGCIACSEVITLENGKELFLKHSADTSFFSESTGLQELEKANCIRVPKVIAVSDHFLLLELIQSNKSTDSNFFEIFGEQLAKLHKRSSDTFGFKEDNYIGSTIQQNILATNHWPSFYFQKRLLFQLNIAKQNGLASPELSKRVLHIGDKIETILIDSLEKPSLLHGDLWSGNFMIDDRGAPVLIDPAVYYGHREADLAMTKLFGGFPEEFYRAYQNEYPLKAGHQKREALYKLYHMLNHLNLFGRSYYSSCLSLALQYSN